MILVSACLLGCACRYDGQSKPNPLAQELAKRGLAVPVCPEQLGGLPTPRKPSERRGDRVVMNDGRDVTAEYRRGAEETLRLGRLYGCTAAVLKEKSPSCGCGRIYDGTFTGTLTDGDGVTAALLKENGIKVMVDVHSPDANNSGHNYELWYGKEMSTGVMVTTEIWMDTWVWLADRYKNDDTLIALDLKNEPHGKRGYDSATCPTTIAKWDNSTDENNWKYAAETCAKKILEVNPNVLIVVEGIEQYLSLIHI